MNENIRLATQRDARAVEEAVNGWWKEDKKKAVHRLDWWNQARFGCFVHWGVYAVAGGLYKGRTTGYAEHLERALTIPLEEYKEEMIDKFLAEKFDADAWIREVKNAGMEYFVITAKHHDGFAMYPSDAYPYDIRMTPFGKNGRDPMQELKEACDKYDVKFGFYYSHAFDWEHPTAPGNDWVYHNPGGDLHLYEEEYGWWYYDHPELLPAAVQYVNEKSIPQILELINNYHPAILWFDTPHKLPLSENLRILKAIREADPNVVVNGRLAADEQHRSYGDYYNTADRPSEIYPSAGYWEGIPTTNESYGYHQLDRSHKPASFFIRLLAQSAARGGNMLMNIGPMGDGSWDAADIAILRPLGEWIRKYREAFYDVGPNPLSKQPWGEVTCNGNTLYLHVFTDQSNGSIILNGLMTPIESIVDMEKGAVIDYDQDTYYDVRIPVKQVPCVLKVQTAGRIKSYPVRRLLDQGKDFLHVYDADFISDGVKYGTGVAGKDHASGLTDTYQQILWKVRNIQHSRYEAEVTYKLLNTEDGGSYRLRIGNKEYIRELEKTAGTDYVTDRFEIEYPLGKICDIQLTAVEIQGHHAAFQGIALTPIQQGTTRFQPQEDTTDLGNR